MNWRNVLAAVLTLSSPAVTTPNFDPGHGGQIIPGPPAPMDRAAWLAAIQQWRDAKRAELNLQGAAHERPELQWTQSSFIQTQMMVEDRYFYDPQTHRYTVDRFLADLDERYGGIDSVLVWPVYPNIGIDNRSQHDLLRDLPGGYDGVRQVVADFHRRGVHVLFPMMPWDGGSRPEGLPLLEAVARNFKAAGIDGVNGDTMHGVGPDFAAATAAAEYPLVFEPELELQDLRDLAVTQMSWGYWPRTSVPPVDRYKWLEPRHLTHVCERWAKDHTDGLQLAFVNGDGFESWENVWGIWNGITPRNAEAIRRVATVERALAPFLSSLDWQPLVPTLQPDVFAGRFPRGNDAAWLLVNRSAHHLEGNILSVACAPGTRFFDVWQGRELHPQIENGQATLAFPMEANGFGAVAAMSGEPPPGFTDLLTRMARLSSRPLAQFSNDWKPLPQEIVPIAPTTPAATAPDGMVGIPAATFHFKVRGVEIEGWGPIPAANQAGVDVQYPGETVPMLRHELDIPIHAFFVDRYPVTNAQFKVFLDATHYRPTDDHNFLKDWSNGTFPAGWDKKPVTWVSLEDARAYANWAGKRLPHEWEWQYAAQGNDGRLYPWGQSPDATAIPPPDSSREPRAPTDVDAFPRGASPFGVMDLANNVWQWTDEFQDTHTRAAILRGGSYYRPAGSQWYFPGNSTLDQHGKYLLMCPGKDRSAMIGFRCVKDAP